MHHRWELVPHDPRIRSEVRSYVCSRCGAGPITVKVMDGKRGIRKAVKNLKIHVDCSVQQVKEVMES